MSIAHLLDTFEPQSLQTYGAEALEDSRTDAELAAYERGYKAAWDDCTNSFKQTEGDADYDFKTNLRELSFTYQEAYAAVSKSLEPLMHQLISVALPDAAASGLVPKLKEMVLDAAKHGLGSVLEIRCSPAREAQLAALLEADQALSTRVTAIPSLNEGQIEICFTQGESQIDLDALAREMKLCVETFFAELGKDQQHA